MIEKLEGVLNFLKTAQLENEETLVFLKPHLEGLEDSLKYIPIGPSFPLLPAEIKTRILNHLCNTDAFTAASVCHEWKKILESESRFTGKTVSLGKFDYNCRLPNDEHRCEQCSKDNQCVNPEVMLKAITDHKIDIHLEIHDPIDEEVDSKLIAAGLTSVSNLSLSGECTCPSRGEYDYYPDMSHDSDGVVHFANQWIRNPLSFDQLEETFKDIDKNEKIMERMDFQELDLSELNQNRLNDCLVNKVKRLSLRGTTHGDMLNFKMFIRKLAGKSSEFTLKHLTLSRLKLPNELARKIGNALCNVEHVEWRRTVPIKLRTMKQLFQNVLTRPVQIKNFINQKTFDCRKLISPEDLKKFLNKMTKLFMEVKVTREQTEAANSLPDVSARFDFHGGYTVIQKGLWN